jgi:hypothetical protein
MGLLFILPVSEKEENHVRVIHKASGSKTLFLRSYSLPGIFFLYLIGIYLLLGGLLLASWASLKSLKNSDDPINSILAIAVYLVVLLIPLIFTSFFFYKKEVFKNKKNIKIIHKLFGITFYFRNLKLEGEIDKDPMSIRHHLKSPNIARLEERGSKGYYNRGHFELVFQTNSGKDYIIDRHSNYNELENLKNLLHKY